VALLTVAGGAVPAGAAGPFGPAQVVEPDCTFALADAAIAVDGAVRGFDTCDQLFAGRIDFFRDPLGATPQRETTPYTGRVLATAWDGAGATYVVYIDGQQLRIGKRVESTGVYAPPTTLTTAGWTSRPYTADVVAAGGRWWVVWSEQVGPGGEYAQTDLFQAHTLLGSQGRTRITTTTGTDDRYPSLAYAAGRMTLVFVRGPVPVPGNGSPGAPQAQQDLQIARSTGGPWLSRLFSSAGDLNGFPDVVDYGGVTYVAWVTGNPAAVVVADDAGAAFRSHQFATPAVSPTVAVSGGHVFVLMDARQRAYLAERVAGVWTGSQVAGAPSSPLRVLARGTKARVVYQAPSAVYVRSQA
jgi:hypothetical protein